ncbi:hypothetical protein EHP00_43 [Ecytonucleospora hepatopenaei]|uniref:Uncharacterized protein n=1 Tax=Ecytonucleospora hepatopenaei TaxID=646526 RepID=A0A1W0E5I5_9MICR|nr:hypothetical protein EHP00_43 [Ecytonucleospora hepatopenaei]
MSKEIKIEKKENSVKNDEDAFDKEIDFETQNNEINQTNSQFEIVKNTSMTYKDIVDIDAIDCEVQMKVASIINEIENEILIENSLLIYDEYKRKKGRQSYIYIKPVELKTDCASNAEEDLFEISGIKEEIKENLSNFKNTDPIIVFFRRKKIKGFLLEVTEEEVVFETTDKKVYNFSFKQIDLEKIKFEKEI